MPVVTGRALWLLAAAMPWPSQALQIDQQLIDRGIQETAAEKAAINPNVTEVERAAILSFLRANLGEPYLLGATGGHDGFDCSGLVLRAYEAAGLKVPRVSADQLRMGAPVPLADLRVGDLLFYSMLFDGKLHLHVVIYIGGGHAIHASVEHDAVREIDITEKRWTDHLIGARTLI